MRSVRSLFTLVAWLLQPLPLWCEPAVNLTVDCAFCGPGQTFPHDCPRDPARMLSTPDSASVSSFVEEARKLQELLSRLNGFEVPALGQPATLADLEATLKTLIAATETGIARLEREQAELEAAASRDSAATDVVVRQVERLRADISMARTDLDRTEAALLHKRQAATARRDALQRTQKASNDLREQIRQTRNRLFPRLEQAERHGWILPPSSYRELPVALPISTRRIDRSIPDAPRESADDASLRRVRQSLPLVSEPERILPSRGLLPGVEAGGRHGVRGLLYRLAALQGSAAAAVSARDNAVRADGAARGNRDAPRTALAALEPEYLRLRQRISAREKEAAPLDKYLNETGARLENLRSDVVFTWIESGIFQALDRQGSLVGAELTERGVNPERIRRLREVAATAAQLGSELQGTVARFPALLASWGESLPSVRQDLAATRTQLGLEFIEELTDRLPAAWRQ